MEKTLILVIAILLVGGLYFYTQNQTEQLRKDAVQSPITAIETHLDQIADAITHVDHSAPNKIGPRLKQPI